jgi:hypothetical protein
MPNDIVPTTDGPAQGKKLSKGVIIALVAGGGFLLYYLYKKKKEGEVSATGEGGYTGQSFIPVTGENVAGVGAPGSGGGSIGGESAGFEALLQANKENNEATQNYLKSGQEAQKEINRENNEARIKEAEIKNTSSTAAITGGGAPASGQASSGAGSGGGGSGATTTNKPSAPTCPSSYPINGPSGCYKNIKCGNGCEGHQYSNHTECQQGEAKHKNCHW